MRLATWAGLFLMAGCCMQPQQDGVRLDHEASHPLAVESNGQTLAVGIGSSLFHVPIASLDPDKLGSGQSSTTYYRYEITDIASAHKAPILASCGFGHVQISGTVGPTGGGGDRASIDTPDMCWSVDFSPDDTLLATSAGVYEVEGGTMRFAYELPSAENEGEPNSISGETAQVVRFTGDGKTVLVFGTQQTWVFDVATGGHLGQWDGDCTVGGLTGSRAELSPDGKRLALVSESNTVSLCEEAERTRWSKTTSYAANEPIEALAWSSDGSSLVAATRSSLVELDGSTLSVKHTKNLTTESGGMFGGYTTPSAVLDVVWHPDDNGRVIATHADNRVVAYTLAQ